MTDLNRVTRWAMAALAALAMASAPARAESPPAADGHKSLGMLNQQTWQMAQGKLPEEFLDRYRKGQWEHEIVEAPPNTHFRDEEFIAAGKANEGKYALGVEGGIIEVATGQQPPSIYGPPFPTIDPKDPQAGAKIVWNFVYQSYLIGNSRNLVSLDWVGNNGMQRSIATEVNQRFFDGQPVKYRPTTNPQNFLFQQISAVTGPADLQGTVALTHRYRDPGKRDQVWTYVPALRRVRAVSPSNRSDGFLGSDMSQDDGSYFDGKPEDFEWKLVGEGEMLALMDRTALVEQKCETKAMPGGAFESRDSLRPRFAYQTPDWSGLAWRPLASEVVLVDRPVWIVEGTPKDKYYLFGKLVLRFDKEAWRGTYSSKYDWQGQILNSYLPLSSPLFLVDGQWRGYAAVQFTMAQNWRLDRATVSYPDPKNPVNQTRVSYPDGFFSVDELNRQGK